MIRFNTLAEMLKSRKNYEKTGIIFVKSKDKEEFLSYKKLNEIALLYLKKLQEKGMKPGDELVFQMDDNYNFICIFWSCILGGIIPVPVAIGSNDQFKLKIVKILEVLNNPYLISDCDIIEKLDDYIDENSFTKAKDILSKHYIDFNAIGELQEYGVEYESKKNDIAFIQFSSGSTGDPKGVILKHRNLLANINAIVCSAKIQPNEKVLSWMPLTHDLGLIGCHLTPIFNEMNQININTKLFIRHPMIWLNKVNEHRVEILQSPNFGYKYLLNWLKPDSLKGMDLSCVKIIFNGAEPISPDICMEFLDKLEETKLSRNTIFPVYGLAEASLAVTFPPINEEIKIIELKRDSISIGSKVVESENSEDSVKFVDVGFPVNDCELRICDDENNIVDECVVGSIQIKGENVTSGYFNNEEATNAAILEGNWLDTGDLGFLRNGRLIVTGRRKDIIFINGQNYYPHDIERVVEELDEIVVNGVVACGVYNNKIHREEICLFVLFKKDLETFSKLAIKIKRHINEKTGLEIEKIVPVKKISKTTSGKIQRFVFKNNYENGEYNELLQKLDELINNEFSKRTIVVPNTDTEVKIVNIFKESIGINTLGITDNFFELGINSLKLTIISNKLYKEFNVKVPLETIFSCSNIKLLAEFIDNSVKTIYSEIEETEEKDFYEVSSAQKRMYILNQLDKNETIYNLPGALCFEGKVDLNKIQEAFQKTIEKNEILRTSFKFIDGEVYQVIHDKVDFDIDIEESSEEEIEQKIDAFIKPFNLDEAPLMRAKILKINENKHILVFDIHHIISDGVSINILLSQINGFYNEIDLPKKELQYKEFAIWQNKMIEKDNFRHEREYWINRFKGEIPVISLPTDYPRKAIQSYTGDKVYYKLSKKISEKVRNIAKTTRTTTYIVMLAAYNILLSKYSGQEDIIVGSPVAGRTITETADMLGMFVNTLAMRNYPRRNLTFEDFLQDVKVNTITAIDNQNYQFEELVEELNLDRDVSRNPLFDTMFTLQNMDRNKIEIPNVNITNYPIKLKVSKFDLSFDIYEENEFIKLEVEYCTDLFEKSTILRMIVHFENILNVISNKPNILISDIDILSEKEKEEILCKFNSKKKNYKFNKLLHQIFEENVEKYPDKLAVKDSNQGLTYRELNKKANRFANYLHSKMQEEGSIVGVMLERSNEMVESILGIWKSGNAYVPLDVEYPIERKISILQDSNAKVLITMSEYVDEEVRETFNGKIICIDLVKKELNNEPSYNLNLKVPSNELAYILFTSGSTGRPKGVMIEHIGMLNHIFAEKDELNLDNNIVFAQNANHCFDISVWQLFASLVYGGTTVIYSNELILEPSKFVNKLIEDKVTLLEVVPTYLMSIMDFLEEQHDLKFTSLNNVIITGETVKYHVVERWFKLCPEIAIVNAYGPAEASDDVTQVTINEIPKYNNNISIGYPLNNVSIYITDDNMNLCPIGVVGEICVSGICVGRGYINNEEKTNESFIIDPFNENSRLYKTGDLGKWFPDGKIGFVGRKDYQVKVRGFRIELGEVESIFSTINGIKDVIVVTKEDDFKNNYLCAYYVAEKEISIEEIKEHLSKYMPKYMIPSYFIKMDRLPLLSNGKVNRKELPNPSFEEKEKYAPPETNTEKKLLDIWKMVIDIPTIGINDNFFSIGGHSLKAAKLASIISKEFNITMPTKEIFMNATIKKMAKYIDSCDVESYEYIEKIEKKEYYELSSAQKRLFVLDALEEGSTMYNMPGVMEVQGKIDINKLKEAFDKLIDRHEILRTSFHYIDNEPYQKVNEKVDFKLGFEKIDNGDITEISKQFIKKFDLSIAPLMRAKLIQIDKKMYLLFDMHHIISDGVSIDILIGELSKLYNGEELGQLKRQYKDFASWQTKRLKSSKMEKMKEYWISKFEGDIPVLDMPLDFIRPSIQSFKGDRLFFNIDKTLTEALNKLASDYECTLNMVLLAAYNVLLSKYSGQDDIVVGIPSAGRFRVEFENIIGMFVNTLAIRNTQKSNMKFSDFLKDVKNNLISAYECEEYQFEDLLENLNINRDISRNPLFDTMFTMNNNENTKIDMNGLKFKPCKVDFNISKFDLSLDALEDQGIIYFEMEYCTDIYKRQTIERLTSHYVNILKEICKEPNVRIEEISVMSEEEKHMIIYDFNNNKVNYDFERNLPKLFEQNADLFPNKKAIIYGENEITYRELNNKSNQLARYLQMCDINKNDIVSVMLERSPSFMESVLAIWKVGAAYIPIDTKYPSNRIQSILHDGNAKALITYSKYIDEEFKKEYNGKIICLDILNNEIDNLSCSNLDIYIDINSLAYILFTSGSTGKPKGVMIEHKGMLNHIFAQKDALNLKEDIVFAQNANQCFDISVWQFFASLVIGGTTVIYSNEILLNIDDFINTLIKDKVTLLEVVPSYLLVIMDYIEDNNIKMESLEYLMITGEAVKPQFVRRWIELCPDIKMVNAYGPAEASDDILQYIIEGEDCKTMNTIPIGKSLNNINVYITDKNMNLCPIGVVGEICVSGIAVGRGYINNDEKNKESFCVDPFQEKSGIRMYKTGDLARWLPDGNVEFVGRKDFQIKVRGFRIELGEIESNIANYCGVTDVVAIVREDFGKNNYICAYFIAVKQIDSEDIKEYLSEFLPDYMIPSYIMQLEQLPLLANGKVDRNQLPEVILEESDNYAPPRNEIEKILVNTLQEILYIEKIGINDNFFSLGGDSIKAIKVVSTLGNLGYKLSVRDIFQNPTIAKLSGSVETTNIEFYQGIVTGEVMLTPVQKAFFMSNYTNMHHYNQSTMLYSKQGIDIDSLIKAFDSIIKKHDALRMTYEFSSKGVKQINRGIEGEFYNIAKYDYKNSKNYKDAIMEQSKILQSSLVLENGPLVKVGVFYTDEGTYILIIIHHLVVDGVSWRIILEDLEIAYNQSINNEEIVLPKKTSSYLEWAKELNNYANSEEILNEVNYWQSIVNVEVTPLPVENEIKENKNKDSKTISISLSKEDTEKLTSSCNKAYNTNINDLLISALGMAVANWNNNENILINLEGHGREELFNNIDVTRTVGWFTAEYPVLINISNKDKIDYIIKNTKETLRRIPKKGIDYGIIRYLSKDGQNKFKNATKPQISFNYLGDFGESFEERTFSNANMVYESDFNSETERDYLLDINGMIINGILTINLEFNEKQFSIKSMENFLKLYNNSLIEIINHCFNKDETEVTPDDVGYNDMSLEDFEDLVNELSDLEDI